MRSSFEGFVAAQMIGYVMKTGASPREGEIKIMVDAAETAAKMIDQRYEKAEKEREAERLKRDEERRAIVKNCVEKHPLEQRTFHVNFGNPLCYDCAKKAEALS